MARKMFLDYFAYSYSDICHNSDDDDDDDEEESGEWEEKEQR